MVVPPFNKKSNKRNPKNPKKSAKPSFQYPFLTQDVMAHLDRGQQRGRQRAPETENKNVQKQGR
jgi:hypothetical protein